LFVFLSVVGARAADDPLYVSTIEGTVDMVDYAHRTISIIPLVKPIGETFRVAGNCRIVLDRKDSSLARLEPGQRVSLAYNQGSSSVGQITAIAGDRFVSLPAREKRPSEQAQVAFQREHIQREQGQVAMRSEQGQGASQNGLPRARPRYVRL